METFPLLELSWEGNAFRKQATTMPILEINCQEKGSSHL